MIYHWLYYAFDGNVMHYEIEIFLTCQINVSYNSWNFSEYELRLL
jgi:hypothetical protein